MTVCLWWQESSRISYILYLQKMALVATISLKKKKCSEMNVRSGRAHLSHSKYDLTQKFSWQWSHNVPDTEARMFLSSEVRMFLVSLPLVNVKVPRAANLTPLLDTSCVLISFPMPCHVDRISSNVAVLPNALKASSASWCVEISIISHARFPPNNQKIAAQVLQIESLLFVDASQWEMKQMSIISETMW